MADNFAKNRTIKAKRRALVNKYMSSNGRDPSTPGATGTPQAFNRNMMAGDRAHDTWYRNRGTLSKPMLWTDNPTRIINPKTKVQHGQAY